MEQASVIRKTTEPQSMGCNSIIQTRILSLDTVNVAVKPCSFLPNFRHQLLANVDLKVWWICRLGVWIQSSVDDWS